MHLDDVLEPFWAGRVGGGMNLLRVEKGCFGSFSGTCPERKVPRVVWIARTHDQKLACQLVFCDSFDAKCLSLTSERGRCLISCGLNSLQSWKLGGRSVREVLRTKLLHTDLLHLYTSTRKGQRFNHPTKPNLNFAFGS